MNQAGGAAIERRRIYDGAIGTGEGEERRHDGRHARIENGGIGGAGLKRNDLVLQNLGIGMRKARIDQVGAMARRRREFAGEHRECMLGRFGIGENISRTAKDRRPRRANRKMGIETTAQYGSTWAHISMIVLRHVASWRQ